MVNSKNVREALVYYEEGNESRWIDALGQNVVKFNLQAGTPCDDQSNAHPTRFLSTVVEAGAGDSLQANSATAGTAMLLTNAGNEYDGTNMQALGEAFKLTSEKPLYFGIKCSISDATQSDLLVGLAEAHGDLLNAGAHAVAAASVEGVFFLKLDAVTQIHAETWKDAAQTATAHAATAMDTSAHTYEILWDGTTVHFYMDSILVTTVAADLPDGDLTPSIVFRNGEAAVKTMTVYWMKCIQIN
jgi:hypothetical protein